MIACDPKTPPPPDHAGAPGAPMANPIREKLTVTIADAGVTLKGAAPSGAEAVLSLSPMEALMLLDILNAEAGRLRDLADAAAPLPVRFDFRKE